jgi:DNA-binding beta-propeller fold protein YncE
MKHRTTTVVAILTVSALSTPSFGQLFGSDAFSTAIGTIDPNDATWSQIGPAGQVITGMAYDRNTDTFYGISPSGNRVYTIDEHTGAARGLPDMLAYDNANGLAFDPINNILYGTDNNTNDLFWVDLANGRSNTIARIGGGFSEIEGLAFDADNDVLYGLTQLQSAIVSIDVRTGEATHVASIESQVWRGLTWDGDTASLYLSAVNIFEDAAIFRYNIADDRLVFVGHSIGVEAVQGLAHRSIPAPASVAVLGLGGAFASRRRRRG